MLLKRKAKVALYAPEWVAREAAIPFSAICSSELQMQWAMKRAGASSHFYLLKLRKPISGRFIATAESSHTHSISNCK